MEGGGATSGLSRPLQTPNRNPPGVTFTQTELRDGQQCAASIAFSLFLDLLFVFFFFRKTRDRPRISGDALVSVMPKETHAHPSAQMRCLMGAIVGVRLETPQSSPPLSATSQNNARTQKMRSVYRHRFRLNMIACIHSAVCHWPAVSRSNLGGKGGYIARVRT